MKQDNAKDKKPETTSAIPRLATVSRLAREWGVREDTIRCWVRRGDLAAIRIGRKILIKIDELPS